MAIAETARLIASLELKDLFSKSVSDAEKSLGKLDKGLDRTQSRAYKAGTQIGTGIRRSFAIAAGAAGFLAFNVEQGITSLEGLEKAVGQTNAVLKSTKAVSGETAASIRDLAQKYENLNATIDDTVIQSGANVLLTFTNIRKQAFEPALRAALNLSTAMGQDLQQSVVQIGKALNDPLKGLTSLQRVGVTFSAGQKEQIKNAIKQNDLYGAQKVILGELDKEFGGSFLAGGQTTAGKVAKLKDAIDDLQRALAEAMLPVIQRVSDALSKFLADPKVVQSIRDLGKGIAGLFSDENLAAGAKFLSDAFDTAKEAAPIVASAAKATFGFVQAAVGLFKQLPEGLQGLLVGGFALNKLTGGLVTNIAGGLAELVGKSRGSSPANPVYVSGVGVGGTTPGVGGGLGKAGKIVLGVEAVAGIIGVIQTQQEQSNMNSEIGTTVADSIKKQLSGGASLKDLQTSLDAVNAGINDIQSNPLQVLVAGSSLDALKAQAQALASEIAKREKAPGAGVAPTLLDRGGRETGSRGTTIGAAVKNVVDGLLRVTTAQSISNREFAAAVAALKGARTDEAIRKGMRAVLEEVTGKNRGNVAGTRESLATLRAALKNTHDPQLQRDLRSAISKVQAKIPGREYAQKQIAKIDKLIGDGKISRSDLVAIKKVEADLKNKGLPHAADVISQKVAKKGDEIVQAENATKAAVEAQKLAVTLNNAVNVSLRTLFNGAATQTSFTRTNTARTSNVPT